MRRASLFGILLLGAWALQFHLAAAGYYDRGPDSGAIAGGAVQATQVACTDDDDADDDDDEQITIVIAPRTWFLFLEEPDRYFENAMAAYGKKQLKEAGRDIQRAATLLKIEAASANKADREPLEAAIFSLEVLGEEVAAGRVKQTETLSHAFALAHYRMAQFHERKAAEEVKEKDMFEAGQELQAASHHLDQGFDWAGSPGAEGLASLIQGVSTVAGQMLAGADEASAAQTEQALRDAATGLKSLGQAVKTDKESEISKAVKARKSGADKGAKSK